MSFRLGENTNLTVEGSYSVVEQKNDRGLPARGTVLPNPNGDIPLNRFLGEPSVDFVGQNIGRIGYQFEHNFNDNWQLRNSFRATFYRQPQNTFLPLGLQEDGRTLERLQNQLDEQDGTSYILDTNVVGNFKTGSIAHKLLFGVDLYRDDPENAGFSVQTGEQNSQGVETDISKTQLGISECRVIQHELGETCVPLQPQRVIVTDEEALDALLGLGLQPIAAAESNLAGSRGQQFAGKKIEQIISIGKSSQVNIERMVHLHPDLIMGFYFTAEN
ncbi:TonB-dependent receptor domain-containing protein [Fischerella thermalis]|uniref:TonB-dependent receptor domain-containing protein n=1 Tax=Fischerella thermalis TaxID=372787 RepID=UPI00215504CA|nr:TonB-dependent receptor [Fischerella thermalis]